MKLTSKQRKNLSDLFFVVIPFKTKALLQLLMILYILLVGLIWAVNIVIFIIQGDLNGFNAVWLMTTFLGLSAAYLYYIIHPAHTHSDFWKVSLIITLIAYAKFDSNPWAAIIGMTVLTAPLMYAMYSLGFRNEYNY